MRHNFFKNLLQVLTFLFVSSLTYTALAKPSVTRPSLRLGFSIRMPKHSWVSYNCFIKNPDPKAHKIMMRITSEQGLSQLNVFEDTIDVPAKTSIEYKTDFMIENSEKYLLEVFSDGKKISSKREEMILKLLPNKAQIIGIINDDLDISFGAFNQLPIFKDKLYSSQFTASQVPENRKQLERFAALVIIKPDFSLMNSRQYKALLEYTSSGGIIIFADPQCLKEVENTPLADLVPVKPLKSRKTTFLPALKQLSSSFSKWTEQVDFLEAMPYPDTQIIVKSKQFPVFAWKRYGLGSCRFSAIPLCGSFYKTNKQTWEDLLVFSFNHQRFYPENEEISVILDEMTGFPIPKTSMVRNIFIGYFAILAVLMILGFVIRRSGMIWGVSGIYAILATIFVLHLAKSQATSKGKLLASLEINTYNSGPYIPVESYYALYSDSNTRLDIHAQDENSLLSAIPPNTNTFLPFAMRAQRGKGANGFPLRESYELQRVNGVPKLADVDLKALRTKQFTNSTSIFKNTEQIARPVLEYTGKGVSLTPWPIPANYNPQYAFLQFPSGIIPLTISNNKIILPADHSNSVFQSDKIQSALQKALTDGFKHTAPAIVLVDKISTPKLPLPDGTSVQGKRVTLFPAKEVCPKPYVQINSEQIVLTPGDSSTRVVMSGNKLKSSLATNGASSYVFNFKLPPVFSRIHPSTIEVDFSYLNQGGNIEAQPYLLYKRGTNSIPTRITGKQKGIGVFVFKSEDLKKVINPLNGLGQILVDAREKNKRLTQAQELRANKWDITKLAVKVKGSLPKQTIPLHY